MQEGGFQAGFQGRSNKKPNAKVKKKCTFFFFLFLYVLYKIFRVYLFFIINSSLLFFKR